MSTNKKKPHLCGIALTFALLAGCAPQASLAQSNNGVTVTLPNGFVTVTIEDLSLQSTAGPVKWQRSWDGTEWKFNPHWESLSHSWGNLTGSTMVDSGGSPPLTDARCWVLVDEDWQPSSGTVLIGGVKYREAMPPARTTPFNRTIGESALQSDYVPSQHASIYYANLCPGLPSSTVHDMEAVRRGSELYLGNDSNDGRMGFDNRSMIEKSAVRSLPATPAAAGATPLQGGHITPVPVTIAKGYRWRDRGGDWIDYNTAGQVVAWGDRNDNTIWMQRDTDGVLRGVIDATGQVLYTLHYQGGLITEIRDYPRGDNSLDLPARSVKYVYDQFNRLVKVTDVRGNDTRYEYDPTHKLIAITDAEGRRETFAYSGASVSQRTAPDGGVTDYLFEYDQVHGQFISKIKGPETAAGRRSEDHTHNRVGKLLRQMVNGRTELEVKYDIGARTEYRTNARGFTTELVHNEFEQVTQLVQNDGSVIKRRYDARDLHLIEETNATGIKTLYESDAKGNRLKRVEAAGTPEQRTTEYEVNGLGQVTRITLKGRTEANGTLSSDVAWQLQYDATGQLQRSVDPEGGMRLYTYDRAGNLARATDPRGQSTRYEVDAAGNLVRHTDALSQVRHFAYDKIGNFVDYTDARSKTARVAYDAMNRRTQTTNAVGGSYRIQYNGQGLSTQQTDEDGRTRQFEYDNFLRLTKYIDGLGYTTEQSYQLSDGSQAGKLGSLGDPTLVKYPSFSRETRYDALERPTSVVLISSNAAGAERLTETTTYDARGLVTSETDAYGKVRRYAYDALGQLIETTDALGHKTSAQYDVRGNLIQLADALGHTTRFDYDRNNRLVAETLPLGQTTRYRYDEAGNLAERTDANGNKSVYSYDAVGRLSEARHYTPQGTLERTTTYTRDAANNLTAWSETDHTRPPGQQTTSAVLAYDDANRKTAETVTYPNPAGGSYSLGYGYTYSAAGKKTGLIWPDGTTIGYGYSAHGELQTVTIPGEGTISINQFNWTRPAKTTLPGGSVQERLYDGLLNLQELKVKSPGQQLTLSLQNSYGKRQDVKQSQRSDTANGLTTTKAASYSYDDEQRLTQAITDSGGWFGTDTETFMLDAVGNRIGHSRVSGAWSYDANNRLTQRGTGAGATSYEYDEAGSLTKKTGPGNRITRYRYDTSTRLVEVSDGAGNPIARYGYDGLHRRTWKEQYRDAQGNVLLQAKRTHYLYADEGLIGEAEQDITNATNGDVTASAQPRLATQYGPSPDALFTTGHLFVKTASSAGTDLVAYYQHDHLGTPLQATDKQGNVAWAARNEAFGAAAITTPSPTAERSVINSNLRLPGQYFDQESGLHYNYFRFYDRDTGRYTQSDPIGLAGGVNTYSYAEGSPITYIDAMGLWAVSAEFYSGLGGGIRFGQDATTGQGFIAIRIGWGVGGGLDIDPLGKRPGSMKKCNPSQQNGVGVTGGVYGGVGGRAGPVKAGIATNAGVTTDAGGVYFSSPKPKASFTNRGTGINASASVGFEFSIFDGSCACQ